jgi:glucose-1-phosphate cytidylyltransferase
MAGAPTGPDAGVKVIILAGGYGTRLQEATADRPKPMVEIGGAPILWHIMKLYAAHGFKEFLVALGYKGDVIKMHFLNQRYLSGSFTIDLRTGRLEPHDERCEDWTVHLIDTGVGTQTGGRIKRLASWVRGGTFMMTYGDGLSNVDLRRLLAFHRRHGRLATVTAVRPPARFGGLSFSGDLVRTFVEKPQIGEGWINGGFFVLEPGALDYIAGDDTPWEHEPLERLAADGQLVAYRHDDFWQCMDTLRDVRLLESLWQTGRAPWKVWDGEG